MKRILHKSRASVAHRMVEKQAGPNFLDPAHEWRRIFAETWGTFLLVLVAAGGGVVAASSGGAVTLGHAGGRARIDGDGDHLFHGYGERRASQSRGHAGLRGAA